MLATADTEVERMGDHQALGIDSGVISTSDAS